MEKGFAKTMPKLGFGLMRLPRINKETDEIDVEQTKKMVDMFLDAGLKYFCRISQGLILILITICIFPLVLEEPFQSSVLIFTSITFSSMIYLNISPIPRVLFSAL